jgi:phosphate transport system substrate-binding protein
VYKKYADAQLVQALKEFIRWILTDGQKRMVPGYLPLPSEVASIGLKAVELLEVG